MSIHNKQNNGIKTFIKYVSLNVMGMIGLSCYILADTFFVAKGLGADGLTSLNLAIPFFSVIHGTGLMIGMGGATRFSIMNGLSNKNNKNVVFSTSVLFAILVSFLFAAVGLLLSDQLSILLGAKDSVLKTTSIYLKTILLFAPMFLLNNLLICFVRNDLNPKLSMLAMLMGSLSNIALDYLFIFPLQMGMFGAALATGFAPIISLSILSFHFIVKRNTFMLTKPKLSFKKIKDIIYLGNSALITELSSGIVMIVFNTLILRLQGNIGVAAYGVIANLSLVVVSLFTGIAQGIQPIISLDYGNHNNENIKKTYQYAIVTATILSLVVYAVATIYTSEIIEAFNKDHLEALTEVATKGLRIYFIGFFFVGFNIITAVYFSSIDKAQNAFTISILRGFIIIIPMALLLSFLFQMNGIWITFPITEATVAVYTATLMKRQPRLQYMN